MLPCCCHIGCQNRLKVNQQVQNSADYLIPVITGTLLFGLLTVFIIFFILLYRRTRVKLHLERERIKQELLRVENEVKEQTLINVSRELHDNLGQVASLIKINLVMISKNLSKEDLEYLNDSLELIQQLITDIRSLSASLNGERLRNIGWINAITEDVRRINALGDFQIKLESEGNSSLSKDKEVVVYRIVQEILNNMLKHARAYTANLKIEGNDDSIEVHYQDNGVGFDMTTVASGQGLNNIRQRCELIDAQLQIESIPNLGTEIKLKVKNDGKE